MGRVIVVLLILAMLAYSLATAAQAIAQGRVLFGALFGLGAFGFITPFLLPAAGALLQNVELPALFHTATIATPDGRRFAATWPLARVQRYDAAGRFETGWFVDSGGGLMAIGQTTDGKIAVAAARTRRVELFNADGSSAGKPRPFTRPEKSLMGDYLRPHEYLVWGVSFDRPVPVANPAIHWNTFLLFPLWSPIIAWLLLAVGLAGLAWQEHRARKGLTSAASPSPS